VGIADLEGIILKTGTISTSRLCPNFQKSKVISLGLVKVAIESENLSDMERLKEGLIKLDRSDPSVNFYINNQGEYILSTCGEVHLERCVKDLQDDFAKGIKLHISDPIITFKETIVNHRLADKKKRVKGGQWEEVETSSEEEVVEEKKAEEEKTLDDIMAEYEAMLQKETKEKEFLRKEMRTDMYIEKILFTKFYRNKQKELEEIGFEKQCAKEKTAN
jgi:translation elongation factor EF-G